MLRVGGLRSDAVGEQSVVITGDRIGLRSEGLVLTQRPVAPRDTAILNNMVDVARCAGAVRRVVHEEAHGRLILHGLEEVIVTRNEVSEIATGTVMSDVPIERASADGSSATAMISDNCPSGKVRRTRGKVGCAGVPNNCVTIESFSVGNDGVVGAGIGFRHSIERIPKWEQTNLVLKARRAHVGSPICIAHGRVGLSESVQRPCRRSLVHVVREQFAGFQINRVVLRGDLRISPDPRLSRPACLRVVGEHRSAVVIDRCATNDHSRNIRFVRSGHVKVAVLSDGPHPKSAIGVQAHLEPHHQSWV